MKLLAKTAALALLTSALTLASCDGGADSSDPVAMTDAGYSKLDAQEYEAAEADFQAAIDAGAAGASLKDATLGLVRAMAYTKSEEAAKTFTDFAATNADLLTSKDYSAIGGELMSAGYAQGAGEIIDAGIKRFEGDVGLLKVLDAMKAKAAAGDADAASVLGGLGYL
ncbi:MAG: hypothetical protein P1V81_18545 [Planctomycetota bacterium]|nr:hypothetical protein [Planctomycetota bacterium]